MLVPAPGACVSFTSNFDRQLNSQHWDKIARNLIAVGAFVPDLSQVTFLDRGLIQRCIAGLEANGYLVFTDPQRGLVITLPGGEEEYHSHKNGAPKTSILDQVPHFGNA